jgi:hypothetical protein
VERCLAALAGQREAPPFEVIVPVDASLPDADAWRAAHPDVRFVRLADAAAPAAGPGAAHLLYDRRRAAGLAAARGEIVALTEDHARPDPDWCAAIARAHRRPCAAIGGAIENAVDRPLHWAVYFCDFGRYQGPLPPGPSDCASDVNVSYKRAALESVAPVWRGSYHETAVHGALRAIGESLWLDPEPVVRQERGPLRLAALLRERFAWGRLYAGKRVREISAARRLALFAGAPALPAWLLARQVRTAWRRRRLWRPFARALPVLALLLVAWSAGEWLGYATGRPVRA